MPPQVTPGYSLFAQHLEDHNFPHTCTISSVGMSADDYDENGQPIAKASRQVRCRIEPVNIRQPDNAGDIITVSGVKVTAPHSETIKAEDKIALPSPWDVYGSIIHSVTVKNNIWGEPSVREVLIL